MAEIPAYEQIFEKVASLLQTINVSNGYATEIDPAAVTRRLLFLDGVIQRGLFPSISVIRKPGGSGRRDEKAQLYYARLPIWCVCYLRADQSAGEIPDTVANRLQNDIQKCIYDNYAALRDVGGIDAGYPEEPDIAIEPDESGVIYLVMFYTVEVGYMLPRRGF